MPEKTVQETVETVDESTEVEKAADVDEVEANPVVDADALMKAVSEQVSTAVADALAKSQEAIEATKQETASALETITKQISDLAGSVGELSKSVGTISERVASVEDATAGPTSEEVEETSTESVNKSLWDGRFLGAATLTS